MSLSSRSGASGTPRTPAAQQSWRDLIDSCPVDDRDSVRADAAGLVYGVSTTDPVTFISLPLVLGVVAFLAGLFPALKASRIDPLEALRVD